jgi:hypothetical protein
MSRVVGFGDATALLVGASAARAQAPQADPNDVKTLQECLKKLQGPDPEDCTGIVVGGCAPDSEKASESARQQTCDFMGAAANDSGAKNHQRGVLSDGNRQSDLSVAGTARQPAASAAEAVTARGSSEHFLAYDCDAARAAATFATIKV